ncbi:hypothetical protein SAMN05421857_3176 [Chryseobacterium formosense]|nr:hypothetical protein SAMN05421857_3176 [Chryseobacterium formosense]
MQILHKIKAYLLEVVTQYASSDVLLKDPRTALFDKPLTVA